jgi:hypothetical protein
MSSNETAECSTCGYGICADPSPERCPMCGTHPEWLRRRDRHGGRGPLRPSDNTDTWRIVMSTPQAWTDSPGEWSVSGSNR